AGRPCNLRIEFGLPPCSLGKAYVSRLGCRLPSFGRAVEKLALQIVSHLLSLFLVEVSPAILQKPKRAFPPILRRLCELRGELILKMPIHTSKRVPVPLGLITR